MTTKRKLKIAILMPTYKDIPVKFFMDLIALQSRESNFFDLTYIIADSTILVQARNILLEQYFEYGPFDYGLFLDSDMAIPDDTISRLLTNNKEIVAGLFFTKSTIEPSFRVKTPEGKYATPNSYPEDSLMEINATGLACVLIKDNVLQSIKNYCKDLPYFDTKYRSRNDFMGEDIYFFELISKLGFKVYMDSSVKVGHIGGIVDDRIYKAVKGSDIKDLGNWEKVKVIEAGGDIK